MLILSIGQSSSKPADVAKDNSKANDSPSACDQSTQTDNVQNTDFS